MSRIADIFNKALELVRFEHPTPERLRRRALRKEARAERLRRKASDTHDMGSWKATRRACELEDQAKDLRKDADVLEGK